jgi:hypothetical protein
LAVRASDRVALNGQPSTLRTPREPSLEDQPAPVGREHQPCGKCLNVGCLF